MDVYNHFKVARKNNDFSKNLRFSHKDGVQNKKLANYTKLKVYSKTETEKIINTIIEGNLGTDSVVIDVSVKYEKSDLLQVNRQLHEWLEIVNNKSDSTSSILNTEEKVNNNLKILQTPINTLKSQEL